MPQIPLFHPYITTRMRKAAFDALGEKIVGQGEKTNRFEKILANTLKVKNLLALNNATSALELAYHILELKPGDEVITPVFTCTATNIPLVRRGVKIVFADIKDNMMLDWDDAQLKLSKKTKAIINVHLFNQKNESKKLSVPVVGDSAQYLGKSSNEIFTAYSFQATKNFTTVDGGALACQSKKHYARAKLLRWYGIDRETDKLNIHVDIFEAGYKYHMNDVTASLGIEALKNYIKINKKIAALQLRYFKGLQGIDAINPVGGSPFLIHTKARDKLISKLRQKGIETGIVHKRNDQYRIFGGKRLNLANMNRLENTYLLLPCRPSITPKQVDYICDQIRTVSI